MATISDFKGNQHQPGTALHTAAKQQYASSSLRIDHDMNPGLIVEPRDIDDIAAVLRHAREQNIAVAIRTGGHQYSGASSTSARNMLLDLRTTFADRRNPDHFKTFEKDGRTFVRTGISWDLKTFSNYLAEEHLFVPHGLCRSVRLGGHVQTGGYGMLGRSFGLFGDHVLSLKIVDHMGCKREIIGSDLYAFLGGSPGNLGVLTHLSLEVYRDKDYEGARALKVAHRYSPEKLKSLIDILVEMSDSGEFPRNYDLCINVLSMSSSMRSSPPAVCNTWFSFPQLCSALSLDTENPSETLAIVVYAQWVPFDKNDVCDMAWFDRLRDGTRERVEQDMPVSQIIYKYWLFDKDREFELPYVKRAYSTNSTTLGTDGWSRWVTERIDAIAVNNHCKLAVQLQCYGGKHSKFAANASKNTSYSWRDTTIVCVLDCFYEAGCKEKAEEWQRGNDEGIGPNGVFSKQDRRMLFGSYGSFDLDATWRCYFKDQAKYERLQKARKAADPDGIFTPNTFCVKRFDGV